MTNRFIKMHWLFPFLIITGESVMKVKRGEDLTLIVEAPKNDISRLTVVIDGQVNFLYCSPEERGCAEINSRNVSLQSSEESVNLTFPEAEGTYNAELIRKDGSVNTFTYDLEFNSTSPTLQSTHSHTTANSATNRTTVAGDNKDAIIGCSVGGIGVIIGVIICVVIYCKWKKSQRENRNNRAARDENHIRLDVNGGEPNAEPIEMVETNRLVDNDNQQSKNMVNGACRVLIN